MKKLLFAVMALLIIACSSTRHSTTPPGSQQVSSTPIQDGSSYENAVVIKEKRESTGVSAEYKWIREHYPGSKTKSQALQNAKGKFYDMLTIETADGSEKQIYFDISNFFGKH